MLLVHPLYEALLERFCNEAGLDARKVREMMRGERPVLPEVVDMFSGSLDVPPGAWPKRLARSPVREALVSRAVSRHNTPNVTPQERNAILRDNGRRRRRYASPVHGVLDVLDWTVADLARHVSEELGRDVSRPSMQFYCTGTRQLGPKGASKSHVVRAPLDVREAAEQVTKREAARQGKGPEGVLLARDWPNVAD